MVLMSHIREASKVTVNSSYFHPAHQHYTDEAHKAETVPSVVIYIYIYIYTLDITRNMGQDGDGHAHFDQIWRPNITINYMGVDQNIKF